VASNSRTVTIKLCLKNKSTKKRHWAANIRTPFRHLLTNFVFLSSIHCTTNNIIKIKCDSGLKRNFLSKTNSSETFDAKKRGKDLGKMSNSMQIWEFSQWHAGRPLTQSNYTRSCINIIVLLKMSTELLETCRGFK